MNQVAEHPQGIELRIRNIHIDAPDQVNEHGHKIWLEHGMSFHAEMRGLDGWRVFTLMTTENQRAIVLFNPQGELVLDADTPKNMVMQIDAMTFKVAH